MNRWLDKADGSQKRGRIDWRCASQWFFCGLEPQALQLDGACETCKLARVPVAMIEHVHPQHLNRSSIKDARERILSQRFGLLVPCDSLAGSEFCHVCQGPEFLPVLAVEPRVCLGIGLDVGFLVTSRIKAQELRYKQSCGNCRRSELHLESEPHIGELIPTPARERIKMALPRLNPSARQYQASVHSAEDGRHLGSPWRQSHWATPS